MSARLRLLPPPERLSWARTDWGLLFGVLGLSAIGATLVWSATRAESGDAYLVRNLRSWLQIPGVQLQPAELAKVALVVGLAMILAERGERDEPPPQRDVLLAAVIGVVPVLLVRIHPYQHTDFVFSVTGEELGFAGAAACSCPYARTRRATPSERALSAAPRAEIPAPRSPRRRCPEAEERTGQSPYAGAGETSLSGVRDPVVRRGRRLACCGPHHIELRSNPHGDVAQGRTA